MQRCTGAPSAWLLVAVAHNWTRVEPTGYYVSFRWLKGRGTYRILRILSVIKRAWNLQDTTYPFGDGWLWDSITASFPDIVGVNGVSWEPLVLELWPLRLKTLNAVFFKLDTMITLSTCKSCRAISLHNITIIMMQWKQSEILIMVMSIGLDTRCQIFSQLLLFASPTKRQKVAEKVAFLIKSCSISNWINTKQKEWLHNKGIMYAPNWHHCEWELSGSYIGKVLECKDGYSAELEERRFRTINDWWT